MDDDCCRLDDRVRGFSCGCGYRAGQTGSAVTAADLILTGCLTIAAALSYGELAAMFPHAGGQMCICGSVFATVGFLYG